jgi:hypothetical protein
VKRRWTWDAHQAGRYVELGHKGVGDLPLAYRYTRGNFDNHYLEFARSSFTNSHVRWIDPKAVSEAIPELLSIEGHLHELDDAQCDADDGREPGEPCLWIIPEAFGQASPGMGHDGHPGSLPLVLPATGHDAPGLRVEGRGRVSLRGAEMASTLRTDRRGSCMVGVRSVRG